MIQLNKIQTYVNIYRKNYRENSYNIITIELLDLNIRWRLDEVLSNVHIFPLQVHRVVKSAHALVTSAIANAIKVELLQFARVS